MHVNPVHVPLAVTGLERIRHVESIHRTYSLFSVLPRNVWNLCVSNVSQIMRESI